MWKSAYTSRKFYSRRYSKCGETFCYLKIDGTQGAEQMSFHDRSEIEDAINAALRPVKLGCVVGGGTGLRYSYVDLALTEVRKAIECVQAVLREGKLPIRSWILFHDSELGAEWVGLYPETPAPLLAVEA